MNTKTVAETILAQLGGQRFVAMTGARNLMSDDSRGLGSLTMKLPRQMTRDGITHVRITLQINDTYKVDFMKVRGVNCATLQSCLNVYAEDLQRIFTEVTGLDTHL